MSRTKTPAERQREYRQRNRDRINRERRERYAEDAEYRQQQLDRNADQAARRRERYHSDTEYRARVEAARMRYLEKRRRERSRSEVDE